MASGSSETASTKKTYSQRVIPDGRDEIRVRFTWWLWNAANARQSAPGSSWFNTNMRSVTDVLSGTFSTGS